MLCITQKKAEVENISARDLYQQATVRILQAVKPLDGSMKVLIEGVVEHELVSLKAALRSISAEAEIVSEENRL